MLQKLKYIFLLTLNNIYLIFKHRTFYVFFDKKFLKNKLKTVKKILINNKIPVSAPILENKYLRFTKSYLDQSKDLYPIENTPLISILAVSFNSENVFDNFFSGLSIQDYKNFELIIVDNNSTDNSLAKIRALSKRFKIKTQIIPMNFNAGFSEGINIASNYANSNLILISNIDVYPKKEWISELINTLKFNQKAAAVCSKVILAKKFVKLKITSKHPFSISNGASCEQLNNFLVVSGDKGSRKIKSVVNFFSNEICVNVPICNNNIFIKFFKSIKEQKHTIYVYHINGNKIKIVSNDEEFDYCPQNKQVFSVINNAGSDYTIDGGTTDIGFLQLDEGQYDTPKKIRLFCGCSVLLRRDYFLEREVFIGEFFGYFEDSELSQYLLSQGYDLLYNPKSIIEHEHSFSFSDLSILRKYLIKRNFFIFKFMNPNNLKFNGSKLKKIKNFYRSQLFKDLKIFYPKISKLIKKYDQALLDRFQSYQTLIPRRKILGIYNSYWNTMGGGENHALSLLIFIASVENFDEIHLISETDFSFQELERRFNLNLDKFKKKVITNFTSSHTSIYHTFINSTFCSNLESFAYAKSYYIVSFPHISYSKKLFNNYIFLFNSGYTLKWSHKFWGHEYESALVLPLLGMSPVHIDFNKNKFGCLLVGRYFDGVGHKKNHNLAIQAFKNVNSEATKKIHLTIVGSLDKTYQNYFNGLVKLRNSNKEITLLKNIDSSHLHKIYKNSRFILSLTGMDADEDNEPQNLEHFGMTIIEGMLNGCIPIVYSKGGPSETVRSTKVGFMFSSLDELTNILNQLQSYKEDILNNLSRKSVIEANNLIKKNKKNFTNFIKN